MKTLILGEILNGTLSSGTLEIIKKAQDESSREPHGRVRVLPEIYQKWQNALQMVCRSHTMEGVYGEVLGILC